VLKTGQLIGVGFGNIFSSMTTYQINLKSYLERQSLLEYLKQKQSSKMLRKDGVKICRR